MSEIGFSYFVAFLGTGMVLALARDIRIFDSYAKNLRNYAAIYFLITSFFMIRDPFFLPALICLFILFMIGGSKYAEEKAHRIRI